MGALIPSKVARSENENIYPIDSLLLLTMLVVRVIPHRFSWWSTLQPSIFDKCICTCGHKQWWDSIPQSS